jgi:glycine/D-amino acid oxidase-like deaminating enzyme
MSSGPVPIGPLTERRARGRGGQEPGPRVVVVGAGLIGAATAEALTRRNARVTVLDRGQAAAGTTTYGMGLVNASARVKTSNPAYLELSVAAMGAHDRVARDLAPSRWLHRSGHLAWVGEEDAEELRGRVELLTEFGYPAGMITPIEARALEPALRVPDDGVVALLPGEFWIEGPLLVRRLLHVATGRGAELREDTEVTGLTREADGRVTGVELAGGERLAADAVVNATGPDAERLARAAGAPLRLRPAPALVVFLETGEGAVPVSRPVDTPTVGVRPHGTGALWMASEATDTALLDPDADVAALTRQLLAALGEAVKVPETAGGHTHATARRPMPADEFPSIGGLPTTPGYYEAVTHSGATLAPLVGELLAEEIITGQAAPALTPFRPERFAAQAGQPARSTGTGVQSG